MGVVGNEGTPAIRARGGARRVAAPRAARHPAPGTPLLSHDEERVQVEPGATIGAQGHDAQGMPTPLGP